jgi:DNA-binding NtrC family response regulator
MSALAFLYDHMPDLPTWMQKLTAPQLNDVAGLMAKWHTPEEGHSILSLEAIERREVLRAVAYCQGNVAKAASILRVGKTTLYNKLKGWGWAIQDRTLLVQASVLADQARAESTASKEPAHPRA